MLDRIHKSPENLFFSPKREVFGLGFVQVRWFSKVFKFIKIYYNSSSTNRIMLKICTIIDIDNSFCLITREIFYRPDVPKCIFYRLVCNSGSRNGMMWKLCTMIDHHTKNRLTSFLFWSHDQLIFQRLVCILQKMLISQEQKVILTSNLAR